MAWRGTSGRGVIAVARITPLADPSPWASAPLGVLVAVGLFCAALLTFGPALLAVQRLGHRAARRLRQENARIDAWVEEDAPRPSGPA